MGLLEGRMAEALVVLYHRSVQLLLERQMVIMLVDLWLEIQLVIMTVDP